MNLFYSFAVGGDGKVYEGRGFNVVGAHAPGYNDKSIGICLIGDWQGKRYISLFFSEKTRFFFLN